MPQTKPSMSQSGRHSSNWLFGGFSVTEKVKAKSQLQWLAKSASAQTHSVKRIQGSESQIPAGLYCNLLLCGIKSLVLSRRLRSTNNTCQSTATVQSTFF